MTVGTPWSTWMTVPSWTFESAPMVIDAVSPRTTAVGQIDTRGPSVTSPQTNAAGWMNAVAWIVMNDQQHAGRARRGRSASSERKPEREITGDFLRGESLTVVDRHRSAKSDAIDGVVREHRGVQVELRSRRREPLPVRRAGPAYAAG